MRNRCALISLTGGSYNKTELRMAGTRRILAAGLSLRHFIMKAEGRSLYRDVVRSVRGLDEPTAAGVRETARERFVANESETDLKRALQPPPTVAPT